MIELGDDDEDIGQPIRLRSSSIDPLDSISHPFDDRLEESYIPPEGEATMRIRQRLVGKYHNHTVEGNERQSPIVPIGNVKEKIKCYEFDPFQRTNQIRTSMRGREPNKVGNLLLFARVGIHLNLQDDQLALSQIRKDPIATSTTLYKGTQWLAVEEFYLGLNHYPNESDTTSSYCLSWETRKMTIKQVGDGPSKYKVEFAPLNDVGSVEVCSNRRFCRGSPLDGSQISRDKDFGDVILVRFRISTPHNGKHNGTLKAVDGFVPGTFHKTIYPTLAKQTYSRF